MSLNNSIMSNIKSKGRPRIKKEDKAKPNDIIKCVICGKLFTRSNRTKHNRTEVHQIYVKMNEKYRHLMFEKKPHYTNNGQRIMTAEDLHVETAKADIRERLKSND
jgi:hypothetical protein